MYLYVSVKVCVCVRERERECVVAEGNEVARKHSHT